ncbi:Phenoloxidase-activating factor 2 [Eumeta japonica]|uniref:Phenoloxidase-activating factor 2 n=1 Tax=Eumeta variegata TaxID=151549 RepID=A0A4C1V3I5_EUMVA|nr:Phenoloxidase-activating factor 2 [Eumeta japonica]
MRRDKPDDDDDNPSGKTPATYLGSGSLIHPSVVLTAGHLVFNNWSYKVRAGITSLHENYLGNELYPHQDRNVKNITVNKEFDKNTLFFDVALLFLESPMTMAPNVGVVCLPSQSDYSSARSNCIGSGWGKDKFGKRGKYRTRMKKFNLTLIDHNKCQEQLQQTRLGLFFELHPTFTCADDSSAKDGCQGDGGSPLVCPIAGENMRYQQRGIVSWGIGCGNTGVPTVYVDVARVRAWIDGAVVAEGLDPQVYTP